MLHLSSLHILRTGLLSLLLSLIILPVKASTQSSADSAYDNRDYTAAAAGYAEYITRSLKEQPAGQQPAIPLRDAYYNLGNARYRLKDYSRAILAYRRALALDPSAADARYNLSLAEARLTDRFDRPQEMFFVTWLRSLMQSLPAGGWHMVALAILALAFCGYWILMRARRAGVRKGGIALSALALLAFLVSEGAALTQRAFTSSRGEAVVMTDTQAYELPGGGGKSIHTLHPGTTVTATGTAYRQGWIEVSLPDGTTAWIERNGIVNVADWGKAL